MKKITFLILIYCLAANCFAQDTITSHQAKNYINQVCLVKGKVFNTRLSSGEKGEMLFIHFEKPYPNNPFKIVIYGKDLAKFPADVTTFYNNKNIQIAGKVTQDRNDMPQIIVAEPKSIVVSE